MLPSCRWRFPPTQPAGVMIGSDLTQEWLLPWWWGHYQRHNNHPVTFVDLGMTPSARAWCQERAAVVRLFLSDVFVKEKSEIDQTLISHWEARSSRELWESRAPWFKKPFACLASSYQQTLWIDLDCEIRGPLTPLFAHCDHPSGLSLFLENPEEQIFNAGVICFQWGLALFETWAKQAWLVNHLHRGDQELLSHLITKQRLSIGHLPPHYNWSRCREEASDPLIYHWHGAIGKSIIRTQLQGTQLI
jgi:hypothetical protein